MRNNRLYGIQRARIQKLISSGEIIEIYDAIEKLPISGREKTVLNALVSRELAWGQIGNTAKEILKEIEKIDNKTFRGSRIGIKIWDILNQLKERQFIQAIEGFPKLYILNRELNPMNHIMYPYLILESFYDVLPELESYKNKLIYRVRPEQIKSSSSGAYSSNQEYIKILINMISLAKKEIIATSLIAQSFEEFPNFIYAIGNALNKGICVYYLLSFKAPPDRIDGIKKLGANVKVIKEEILLQHGISNFIVIDRKHFIQVDRYEIKDNEKIRFGVWCKFNKPICNKYVKIFWDVWKRES